MKRTFKEIRKDILINLGSEVCSINYISKNINVNWRTVEKHLVYLVGRGYVEKIYSCEYVRLLKRTESGEALAILLESEDVAI